MVLFSTPNTIGKQAEYSKEISNVKFGTMMSPVKPNVPGTSSFSDDEFEWFCNVTPPSSDQKVWGPCLKCNCDPKCEKCNHSRQYVVVGDASKHRDTSKIKDMEDEFYDVTDRYYVENSISVSVELLESSLEGIVRRLSAMAQQCGSEWNMFLTASFWMRHDVHRRLQHAVQLLGCIKFSNMAPNDYTRCCKYIELWDLSEIPGLMQAVQSGSSSKKKMVSDSGEGRIVPQVNALKKSVALIIGGKTSTLGMVLMGNADEKMEWRSVRNQMPKMDRAECVVLGGFVYACGGWTGDGSSYNNGLSLKRASNFLWRFDPLGKTWTTLKPMRYGRALHSAVAINGMLFVFGGVDDDGGLMSSTECYNPETNKWSKGEEMPMPLCAMAACEFNGQVWLAGGLMQDQFTGKKGTITDEVLVYNPRLRNSSRWFFAVALRVPRAFACLTLVEDNLYLSGGLCKFADDVVKCVSDVDVFEVTEETSYWRHRTDMQNPRNSFAAVYIGETLVFIGGVTSDNTLLSSAEIYNTKTGKWTLAAHALPEAIAGLAGVVI